MGKPPAFQFYAADFDMDTGSWTAPQVGVYVRLLMSAWVNGGLPNNMAEIARIARIDGRTLAKMWRQTLAKKWTLTPENVYVNPRMEIERQKQQNYKEKQSLKGKLRAEEMWKDHIAAAKNRLQPEDSSSSSSSSSIIIHNPKKDYVPVSVETGLIKSQQRIKKLKTEKQAIKEKIKTEFETNLSFLKEKFPLLDLEFELALIQNWVDTSFSKAKKWASGDLNLAFQNWMRRAKPPAQNQNYQPVWEDSDVRAKRILGLAHKIGKIPE